MSLKLRRGKVRHTDHGLAVNIFEDRFPGDDALWARVYGDTREELEKRVHSLLTSMSFANEEQA